MAESLVDSLTAAFEPEKYRDEYREQVLDLIQIKAAGETFEMPEAVAEQPKVIDLMAALEASVARAKEALERHESTLKHEEVEAAIADAIAGKARARARLVRERLMDGFTRRGRRTCRAA